MQARRGGPHLTPAHPPPSEERLPHQWQQFLHRQWQRQAAFVTPYEVHGQRVWLKRAMPRRAQLPYRALYGLAMMTGLEWLKPAPTASGGLASIAVEVRRLRELAEAGVNVPRVLATRREAFLMEDLGSRGTGAAARFADLQHLLDSAAERRDVKAVLSGWAKGLAGLAGVHRKRQYLSQAFARNMVIDGHGKLAFIDFEEDPRQVMPLHACQVRDLFCYLHTSALPIWSAGTLTEARTQLHQWLATQPREVQGATTEAVRRLRFLRWLPLDRRWGKDVLRIKVLYLLLASRPVG